MGTDDIENDRDSVRASLAWGILCFFGYRDEVNGIPLAGLSSFEWFDEFEWFESLRRLG